MVSYSGMPPYVVYGAKEGEVSGSDVNMVRIMSSYFGFDYVMRKEPFWAKMNQTTGLWEGTIGSVGDIAVVGVMVK